MNPTFQRLMAEATRLTHAGDLHAATAAIQAALRGDMAGPMPGATRPAHAPGDVIDVQARVIHGDAGPSIGVRHGAEAAPLGTPQGHEAAPLGTPQGHEAAPFGTPHGPDARPPGARRDPGATPDRSCRIDPRSDRPRPPHAGQFIAGHYSDPAGTREYKLYVPPGYRGQPLPLVVMLHGCTQDPDDFAAGTGMNEAALHRDFFVLYPAQVQHANASRCWNWFKRDHQRRGRGEPALLAGMTREVMTRYAIDPRRVYVAGLSAGGAMAAILGDAYPDVFAAVGVHSGLPTGSATDVKSAFKAMKRGASGAASGMAPPTIVFHGDRDMTVHPVNGERVVAACAVDTSAEHVQAQSGNGRHYTRRIHRARDGRVVAEHWVVHGTGHAWSGGSPDGSYTDTQGPDATDEMLRFFFAHSLHGAG